MNNNVLNIYYTKPYDTDEYRKKSPRIQISHSETSHLVDFDVDDDSGIYFRHSYESEHVYHI